MKSVSEPSESLTKNVEQTTNDKHEQTDNTKVETTENNIEDNKPRILARVHILREHPDGNIWVPYEY